MAEIVPSITVETDDDYKKFIDSYQVFTKHVHIDTSDGEFTPTFLLGTDRLWWPQDWLVDIHAMVMRPSEHVKKLVALKPNMIIFHTEVQEDIIPSLQFVKQNNIKLGIALQRPTVPETIRPIIELADHVMIFSGDLGHYGGKASLIQLEKIRLIHAINDAAEIGWDGGVVPENAFTLAQGGVDIINVGGAIAKNADPAAAYKALVGQINKQGVI
ncbi:MAG: hypothetical protein ACSLEY_00480 [Candidatus Saccharimonadales bacterium]